MKVEWIPQESLNPFDVPAMEGIHEGAARVVVARRTRLWPGRNARGALIYIFHLIIHLIYVSVTNNTAGQEFWPVLNFPDHFVNVQRRR